MADKYRGTGRELYEVQKREIKHVERIATHPLERAVYVYSQRDRLGRGSPLTLRQMVPFIANHGKLLDAVDRIHARERRNVAEMQKAVYDKHIAPLIGRLVGQQKMNARIYSAAD